MTTRSATIEMPQQEAGAEPNRSGNGGFSRAGGRQTRCGILSISACSSDYDALRGILNDPVWQITRATSLHQAIGCLCRDRPAVIICDSHLPDGNWRDLLSYIAALMDPPVLIVTAGSADQHLLSEVLDLGGYCVLTKPFQADEIGPVLAAAWKHAEIGSRPIVPSAGLQK
jgi:DNA-binding response OmpR family regulator